MWIGNHCYAPKDVELALEGLFGESVRHVKVVQYSIFVRFHWRAIATTRPNRIYLRGSGKEFFADGPLVLHEYFHVLRQWATGDLTIPRYLLECFRRGYWDNRYEDRSARIHRHGNLPLSRVAGAAPQCGPAAWRAADPRRQVGLKPVSLTRLRGGTAGRRETSAVHRRPRCSPRKRPRRWARWVRRAPPWSSADVVTGRART